MFDALRICRALGLGHIWIDSLCIVQDDRQDWLSQIPLMSSIYSGATVVVSAQAASTVFDGCLGFGPAANAPMKRIEVDTEHEGVVRRVQLSIQEENMRYFDDIPGHHSQRPTGDTQSLLPLSLRAWAYQERFLANRTVFFTASEMSWQCAVHSICECQTEARQVVANPYGDFLLFGQLAPILQAERDLPSAPLKKHGLWCEIIRQYSSRQLTVWTDRLAALQGAVEALTCGMPDVFKAQDYVFGFWRPFLERSLSWHRDTLSPAFGEGSSALRSYAPSWSWVSCPAPTEYYSYEWNPTSKALVEIVDLEVKYSTPMGSFGPGSGKLTVKGHLIPVRREYDEYMAGITFRFPDVFDIGEDPVFDKPVLTMEFDDPLDEERWNEVTRFLPLMRGETRGVTQGIFLVPVEKGVWRRMGYAYDYGGAVPWLEVDMAEFEEVVTLV